MKFSMSLSIMPLPLYPDSGAVFATEPMFTLVGKMLKVSDGGTIRVNEAWHAINKRFGAEL
jgi:hypothetical protein